MKTVTRFSVSAVIAAAAVFMISRRRKKYDLSGKTVLITGGSRGLGLAMAREFARLGSRVAVCARNSIEVQRALDDQELARAGAIGLARDVTNRDNVREMVEAVHRELGPIDILVNNAGVIQVGPSELMNVSDYEEAMRTHFWGPVYATAEVSQPPKPTRS